MKVQQVKFRENGGDPEGGILVDEKYIITGFAGCVVSVQDVEIIERYHDWTDISAPIIDDELPAPMTWDNFHL